MGLLGVWCVLRLVWITWCEVGWLYCFFVVWVYVRFCVVASGSWCLVALWVGGGGGWVAAGYCCLRMNDFGCVG